MRLLNVGNLSQAAKARMMVQVIERVNGEVKRYITRCNIDTL